METDTQIILQEDLYLGNMKKVIVTENDIKQMVTESTKRILKEFMFSGREVIGTLRYYPFDEIDGEIGNLFDESNGEYFKPLKDEYIIKYEGIEIPATYWNDSQLRNEGLVEDGGLKNDIEKITHPQVKQYLLGEYNDIRRGCYKEDEIIWK